MCYIIKLETAKFLDLFDDIPYKYLKDFYLNDDTDKNDETLDIDMIDLPCDRIAYSNTKISFEIRFIYDICFNGAQYKTLKCEKVIHYNNSSGIALKVLMEIIKNDYPETESDDDLPSPRSVLPNYN
jgi:hypothetical protein